VGKTGDCKNLERAECRTCSTGYWCWLCRSGVCIILYFFKTVPKLS